MKKKKKPPTRTFVKRHILEHRLDEAERRIVACWNRNETIFQHEKAIKELKEAYVDIRAKEGDFELKFKALKEELIAKAEKGFEGIKNQAQHAQNAAEYASKMAEEARVQADAGWRTAWMKEQHERIEIATKNFFEMLEIQRKKLQAALEALQ